VSEHRDEHWNVGVLQGSRKITPDARIDLDLGLHAGGAILNHAPPAT
jgi:hypothetical protein